MILLNEKIKKPDSILKAVVNELYKKGINIDGDVEIFNDGKEQGMVLKIFDKYNSNIDFCYWVYMAKNRETNNQVTILVGNHSNCTSLNTWAGNLLDTTVISNPNARIMHCSARDYLIETITNNLKRTYDLSNTNPKI